MESKKYNKLVNIQKRSRLTDVEKKLAVTSEEEGQYRGGGGWKVQTTGCKMGYKDVLYNTGNIANIL